MQEEVPSTAVALFLLQLLYCVIVIQIDAPFRARWQRSITESSPTGFG